MDKQPQDTKNSSVEQLWHEFHASKFYVPTNNNSNPPIISTERTVPYCLHIHYSQGIPVPSNLTKEIVGTYSLSLSLNVSFFHFPTQSFFGNTSTSLPIRAIPEGLSSEPQTILSLTNQLNNPSIPLQSAPFDERFYFHTAINDPSVFAIIEIIMGVVVNGNEVRKAGVGWTFVRPFLHSNNITELPPSGTNVTPSTTAIYVGTPRSLFFITEDLFKELVTISSVSKLAFSFHVHSSFMSAIQFLRENELVTSHDVVPGVSRVPYKNTTPTDLSNISAYQTSHLVYSALEEVLLEESNSVTIAGIRVAVPKIYEDSLLRAIKANRSIEHSLPEDSPPLEIIERRVSIGVHNGITLIRPSTRAVLSGALGIEDLWEYDSLLVFMGVTKNPCFALVIQLEYVVRIPVVLPTRKGGVAGVFRRGPTHQDQSKLPSHVDKTIPLGCSIFIPYQGVPQAQEDPNFGWEMGEHDIVLTAGPNASLLTNQFLFSPPGDKERLLMQFQLNPPSNLSPPTSPKKSMRQSSPIKERKMLAEKNFNEFEKSKGLEKSRGIPPLSLDVEVAKRILREPTTTEFNSSATPPINNSAMSKASTLTRATRAKLFDLNPNENGIRPIEVGSISTSSQYLSANVLSDTLPEIDDDGYKGFEIVFQFLTFTWPPVLPNTLSSNSLPTSINRLFFSIQFYRFPVVCSDIVTIEREFSNPQTSSDDNSPIIDDPHFLRASDGKPGYQIKFTAAGRSFLKYLQTKTLSIDIWDGNSLLYLGSISIELKPLLNMPKNSPAVQLTDEYDIIYREFGSDEGKSLILPLSQSNNNNSNSNNSNVQALIRGKLSVRVANFLKTVDKVDLADLKPVLVVEQKKKFGQGGKIRVIPKRMVDVDQTLKDILIQRSVDVNNRGTESIVKSGQLTQDNPTERKAARIERARKLLNSNKGNESDLVGVVDKVVRDRVLAERSYRTITLFRDRSKRENVARKLLELHTTQHSIYPSFGSVSFFEVSFQNPYPLEMCFSIRWDDPLGEDTNELSVVRNHTEWLYHRKNSFLNVGNGGVEEDMIDIENRIWMHPHEQVMVPFKFQSFRSGPVVSLTDPNNVNNNNNNNDNTKNNVNILSNEIQDDTPIQPRNIQITFSTVSQQPNSNSGRVVLVIDLRVLPQPFIVDRTLRFYNPENEFIKKNMTLYYPPSSGTIRNKSTEIKVHNDGPKYIKCTNSNVVVGNATPSNAQITPSTNSQNLFIKYRCGAAPSVSQFYLLLFNDQFQASLHEIWKICVHSLQRYDLNGLVGATTKGSLIVRGGSTSRLVQCFSSNPEILRVQPSTPFTLVGGALNEISLYFLPLDSSQKEIYVQLVDVDIHQVVGSWVVMANSTLPHITKTFEMTLATGLGANKKISYTNPYPIKKKFLLRTSRPDLVRFKDSNLEIEPRSRGFIGLRFLPAPPTILGRHEILIFVNDADLDKNEECISLPTQYLTSEEFSLRKQQQTKE